MNSNIKMNEIAEEIQEKWLRFEWMVRERVSGTTPRVYRDTDSSMKISRVMTSDKFDNNLKLLKHQ